MNAENYIKAFQGVMGFYGLSFLIAPAKMQEDHFNSPACVVASSSSFSSRQK